MHNTLGLCHADQVGPTAVPYTLNPQRTCPGAYSSEYGGGENPPPIGGSDFLVPGLKSDYIIRCAGGKQTFNASVITSVPLCNRIRPECRQASQACIEAGVAAVSVVHIGADRV